jgi:16S rRNA (cytosine967-C5)-methyltransferase
VRPPSRPSSLQSRRPPEPRPGVAARAAATALYSSVLDRNQPFDRLIDPVSGDSAYRALPPRDRRMVHAIVACALRREGEIEAILGRLIEKKPPKRSGPLARILEIAAAQILFLDLPDHAVVSVALEQIVADRDARHFRGLANAVLRRLTREKETSRLGLDAARLNTPDWFWQHWSATYGETTARLIAEMHLVEPSLDLTVKSTPELWAERLGGIVLPTGSVRLIPTGPIEALAGYAEGEWWVQDAAASLPARLLGSIAGKRVADLCAAPGGKTMQIALAGANVTAVDISAPRLRRVSDNLSRLRLMAETVAADILEWTPAEPFDAVLLDAPCSSTGTIRRHPDIARLRRPAEIEHLSELQEKMLDRAVAMLKPGGILVYCTCSLEPEEGDIQFDQAVARHNLTPLPVKPGEIGGLSEAITPQGTVRTLPSQIVCASQRLSGLDGFFIGRCQKA